MVGSAQYVGDGGVLILTIAETPLLPLCPQGLHGPREGVSQNYLSGLLSMVNRGKGVYTFNIYGRGFDISVLAEGFSYIHSPFRDSTYLIYSVM